MKKPKIDVKQLKPKRRRVGKNVRSTNFNCPYCLSTIVVNDSGRWECTGNKLTIWRKEFERYKLMNKVQKQEYLEGLANKDKFLEWYSQGDTPKCNWNSELQKPDRTFSIKIPDPIAVGKVEKSIGRQLTEEELEEGYKFYRRLNHSGSYSYLSKPAIMNNQWEEYELPRINFPEDV